ncbi:natterin-3-like [Lutzomyia longipalpis]|uniref:natterin-3-like n=1 Tax=Lutzomyia longipalpis TaxID=7200 RepID=UPI002483530B|nr:natterin-3-like [Lutzomyia longipalpis]
MSNIGWNVKADGAERPIQPTPTCPPHQAVAANVNADPTSQPPPSYNSLYPQIPNNLPAYVPPQNPTQIHGTSTTINATPSFLPTQQIPNPLNLGQNIGTQIHTVPSSHGSSSNTLWLPASEGQVPPGAVIGGHEVGGEKLYIARARHSGALIPGKLVPSHRCCYVAWGGREHAVKHYEVLCNCPGKWIPASRGNLTPRALQGGTSEKGETLYVGRANHRGSQTIGKVHPSHKLCYIPYAGKEIGYKAYEVYVPDN